VEYGGRRLTGNDATGRPEVHGSFWLDRSPVRFYTGLGAAGLNLALMTALLARGQLG